MTLGTVLVRIKKMWGKCYWKLEVRSSLFCSTEKLSNTITCINMKFRICTKWTGLFKIYSKRFLRILLMVNMLPDSSYAVLLGFLYSSLLILFWMHTQGIVDHKHISYWCLHTNNYVGPPRPYPYCWGNVIQARWKKSTQVARVSVGKGRRWTYFPCL